MSRKTRIILMVLGLLFLAIAIAALSFAFAPARVVNEMTPVAPTLFTLPPGGLP